MHGILLCAATPSASQRPVILAIFVITCLGLAIGRVPGLKLDRTGIVLLGAIAVMIFGRVPTQDTITAINWPTMLLLFGFFVISAQLRLSGFFDVIAARLATGSGHPARFLLLLMLATAGLSAVLNHDIVCFVFTPVVAAALIKRRLNPVPFLIALAIASNIGAAATFVGNPQDMMIAQLTGITFGRYLAWCIVPVLFALGCAYGVIWGLARNRLHTTRHVTETKHTHYEFNRGHTIKGLAILVVVLVLLCTTLPMEIVALTAAAIHLASPKFRTADLLRLVNWPILVLFAGLFVVTGAFQQTGYADQAVQWLAQHSVDLHAMPTLALVTAALSNIVGNATAVMLLLKAGVGHPPAAYVLALANSFGGSLIILGSVANIIMVHQARENGIRISFLEFARYGIPVTLAAIAGLIAWTCVLR